MRKLLLALGLFISLISSAQVTIQNSGSKIRYVNGVYVGTKQDAQFGTADSGAIYAKDDSMLMFKYKGTARALMYAANVGTQIHDSLYAVWQLKSSTSAGSRLVSNNGTVVAEWGLGGSANMDFHGFAGYNANRSSSYTNRSFVDKGYADSLGNLKQNILGYTPENVANKGANNGYPSLDAGGKVPISQLPSSLMLYKGTWDASTNTPTLNNSIGIAGWVYQISDYGIGSYFGTLDTFYVGDYIMYSGTSWEVSSNTVTVRSVSVNGSTAQQGVVSITLPNSSVTNAMLAGSIDYSKMNAATVPTWNQNTTGNAATATLAANSTLWNGYSVNLTTYGTNAGDFLNYDNTENKIKPFSTAQIQTKLGLGSYAYRSSGLAELSGASFTGNIDLGYNNQINFGGSPYRLRMYKSGVGMLESYIDDEYNVSNTALNFRFRVSGTPITTLRLNSDGTTVFGGAITGASADFANVVKGYSFTSKGISGGWDRSFSFEGSTGTNRGGFGAFGSDNSLSYYYIGNAYNNNKLQIDASTGKSTFTNNIETSGVNIFNVPAHTAANEYSLELYSTDQGSKEMSIRFHEGGQWYKQIRADANAFYFTGGVTRDYYPIFASQGNFSTGTLIPNGAFYRANRLTGGAEINLLGIESGTDNTVMVASNYFKFRNTGTGDAANLLTIDNSGNAVLKASLTAGGSISSSTVIQATNYISTINNAEVFRMSGTGNQDFWLYGGGTLRVVNSGYSQQLFTLNQSGDGYFYGSSTASSFIKAGGTSSQYLMADGSVSTGSGTGGSYTSSTYGLVNCSSATITGLKYMRTGNIVHVSGKAVIVATSSAAQFEFDLPISTNLINNYDLSGVINSSSTNSAGGFISAEITNERAIVSFGSASSGTYTSYFEFTYIVQ